MSWQPTLKAIRTADAVESSWSASDDSYPGQANKRFGIGAVNYHSGETVVIIRRRKRREQIAELLLQLLKRHPAQMVYVAWYNADTCMGGEIDAVVRGAAGRLVLLYLPTYSP